MSHGRWQCKGCGVVIRQCRCIKNHDVTWTYCGPCASALDKPEGVPIVEPRPIEAVTGRWRPSDRD